MSKTKRIVIFEIGMIIFSGLILAAAFLESLLELGENQTYIENLIELIMFVCLFIFLFQKRQGFFSSIKIKENSVTFLGFGLIPVLLVTFACFCIPNHFGGTGANLNLLFGAITTAAAEEIYFRAVGTELFEENGKVGFGYIILMIATYAVSHLIYCIFDWKSGLVLTATTLISGAMFVSLFLKTRNLMLVSLIHLLFNLFSRIFVLNSNTGYYFNSICQTIFIISAMASMVIISIFTLISYFKTINKKA